MGDIVVFRDGRTERTWVPKADEERWVSFWQRGGVPAARWTDYTRWGGFWPRITESADRVMLRRRRRQRTNYARWDGYP